MVELENVCFLCHSRLQSSSAHDRRGEKIVRSVSTGVENVFYAVIQIVRSVSTGVENVFVLVFLSVCMDSCACVSKCVYGILYVLALQDSCLSRRTGA